MSLLSCSTARPFQSLLFVISLAISNLSVAQTIGIGTDNGITLQQITYPDTTPQISATGLLNVDLIRLRGSTGLQNGYINMTLDNDWVVKNLVVIEEQEYPYSRISTYFDLKTTAGLTVSELSNVAIAYSATAITDKTEITATTATLQVASTSHTIGGVPDSPVSAPRPPPNLNDILFGDPTNTDAITQFDHPNIEAALNQCMPASVANSLQFLEDTTDLEIPHEHVAGLKGDNSLVGKLDTAMDRTATSRQSGQGVWGIAGKMKYLAENGLQDRVQTTHMGAEGQGLSGDDNFSVTVDGKTATATGLGSSITFQTLIDSMKEGQDCELVYSWPGGAHAVDAVAAGVTRGEPWIVHGSDLNQSDDTLGAGPEGFKFEYLKDDDKDGQLNLSGSDAELVQVICQKYIEPPTKTSITGVADPGGHANFVEPPPATLKFTLTGSTLTVTGNAPWLPMTGTVNANGSVTLNSTGTVAGRSNVASTLTGTYNPVTNTVDGANISLGTNGALPGGSPITYSVNFSKDTPAPVVEPVIRVNGFRDQVIIGAGDSVSVTLELDPAGQAGVDADWWVVAQSGGAIFSFNLAAGQFVPGVAATFQGPLTNVPFTPLAAVIGGLPSGTYTFYFGIDTNRNGVLDENQLVYSSVELMIR